MEKETKRILRKKLLNLLRTQKEETRLKKSTIIREKLFALPEFQKADTILFYASFDGEVETFEMIKQAQKLGKTIALPKIIHEKKHFVPVRVDNCDTDLAKGTFGIKEPKTAGDNRQLDIKDIDMVIVPGLAFDADNNRLGRGGGYYDNFLAQLPSGRPTVGLAFDFQILDSVPQQDGYDIPVSRVIAS